MVAEGQEREPSAQAAPAPGAAVDRAAGLAAGGEVGGVLPRRLRGSRQYREPGRPRLVRHVVKVHPEVEQRLVLKAAERGNISVAKLLVESALAGGAEAAKTKADLSGELFRVSRLLGKVGVNVNQIARATNATLESQPETFAAMDAITRVCARLEQLLDDVDGRRE